MKAIVTLFLAVALIAAGGAAAQKGGKAQAVGAAGLEAAKKALDAGKWSEALKLYEKAAAASKGSPEALWGKGQVYIRKGDYKAAKQFCQSFIGKQKQSPWGHACLGYAQLVWKRSSLAATAFGAALAIDPDFSPALAGLGLAHLMAGKKKEGEEKLREALDKNPDELEAIIGLADLLLVEGRRDEAIEVAVGGEDNFSDDPRFLFILAKALANGEVAEQRIRKANGIREGWAEGLQLLAQVLLANAKYGECESTAAKALELEAALVDAKKAMGICQFKGGKLDEAIATLEALIEKVPNLAEAMYIIGQAHDAKNAYDKAEEAYQRAMSMDSKYVPPIVAQGYLYYRIGKATSAMSTLEKAVSLEPKSSFACQIMADIFFERSSWAKAKEQYEKALAGDMVNVDKAGIDKRLKEIEAQQPPAPPPPTKPPAKPPTPPKTK